MNFGSNIRLTRAEIDAALKDRALTLGKARGLIPQNVDALDFQGRVVAHYAIAPGGASEGPNVTEVMLTWEL